MASDGIDLQFSAPPGSQFTTGEWHITRGEVPKGGVYIGTLAGGYTIWSDTETRGGMEGDEAATASLIRAAPVLFAVLAQLLEGERQMPYSRAPLSKKAVAAIQPRETEVNAIAVLLNLRLRAAVRLATQPLTEEEEDRT